MVVVCSEGSLTPRKYKPIFFVRCNAFEAFLVLREQMFSMGRVTAVPARVRRSRRKRSLFPRQVKTATSCRNTCISTSYASEAEAVPAESNESVTKNNRALTAQYTYTVEYKLINIVRKRLYILPESTMLE